MQSVYIHPNGGRHQAAGLRKTSGGQLELVVLRITHNAGKDADPKTADGRIAAFTTVFARLRLESLRIVIRTAHL